MPVTKKWNVTKIYLSEDQFDFKRNQDNWKNAEKTIEKFGPATSSKFSIYKKDK